MSTLRPVRWADLLCQDHAERIARSTWRAGGGWADFQVSGEVACRGCYEAVQRTTASGPVQTVYLPDVSAAEVRHATARHEAAHAVLADRSGFDITEAMLSDDDRGGGQVRWGSESWPSEQAHDRPTVAGWVADWQWAQRRFGEVDLATAVDLAARADSDHARLCTSANPHHLRVNLDALVDEHRAEIDAVAEQLLAHGGRLDGAAVHAAITQARCRPSVTQSRSSRPGVSPTPTPPANTTGGADMSVEQVRAGIADAAKQSRTVGAGLASVAGDLTAAQSRLVGLAGELSQTAELLASCAQGSQAEEIERAVAQLRAVLDETDRLPAQLLSTTQVVEQLPAELQAATQAAEDYANRL